MAIPGALPKGVAWAFKVPVGYIPQIRGAEQVRECLLRQGFVSEMCWTTEVLTAMLYKHLRDAHKRAVVTELAHRLRTMTRLARTYRLLCDTAKGDVVRIAQEARKSAHGLKRGSRLIEDTFSSEIKSW